MAEARANLNIGANTTEAVAAIKNLQRQISTFYTSVSKGSAASQAAMAGMQKNLINSINATGQFSARVQTVSSTTESFTNALEKNKLSMGQYFRFAGASTRKFGKNFQSEFRTIDKVARERVKDLQTQYIQLGRDANGAMKAIAVRPATLDLKNFTTQTQITAQKQAIFNQLIQQGSTNLLNWGKNTQWAGRQLMVGFTIPLTIFATTAGRAFMELEEQTIKFKRVYGDLFTTGADTDKALQEMRELGDEFTKFGVAVEETIGLASRVAQMGKTGAELTSQVTEATRLSVLGGMSQEEALDTTIGLTNAFGTSVEDLTNKVNFLNAAENQTILSIQDFNEAVPRAGSVVAQLGGGVEDLAFFMTAMREGGIEASQAANALKSSLGRLINPTKVARDRLREYGIDVVGIVESNVGDLRGTVMDLAFALDELEPLEKSRAIEQLFGKFQFARMSALFQNIINEGSQSATVLDLINSSASDLSTIAGRELGRVEESAATKFTAAVEKFQAALAPIGAEFLKLATPILEFGTKLLKNFNSLGEGTKKAVTMIIGAIGGIMPVALMAIGLTANLIANIVKGLNRVRLFFQKFKGQSQELASQTNYLTQEQLESQAVSSSLEQSHQKLSQAFNVEADSLRRLTQAYERAVAAQRTFRGDIVTTGGMAAFGNAKTVKAQGYNDGVVSVPGTGNKDTVPAMLTPGEAVIPKEMTKRYAPIINAMVSGNVPGYMDGLGVPGVMANLPRATREGNYVASHGNLTAPTNLLETIRAASNVNKEFAETKVVVWQLHQELDEAGNVMNKFKTVSEMTFAELGQMADENQLALQTGRQYAGSTITTTAERNAALNDLNFAGEPMRLEDLIDADGQGDGSDLTSRARQAKAENTAAYQRHTDEIEQMIAQGQVYENAIVEGASVEELKTDYARAQIKNYIAEAEVKKNGLSIEQAQIEADKKLLAIDNQYASLQERRVAYLGAAVSVNPEVAVAPAAIGRDTLGQVASSRRGNLFPTVGPNPTGRMHPTGGPALSKTLPQIYPSIDDTVHGVMDQAMDYIPVSIDKYSQSSSPSKKVQRSAKNLVDGFLVSVRNAQDDMQQAGARLGQAAVSGMVSQGGHNVPILTPDYISSNTPSSGFDIDSFAADYNSRPFLMDTMKAEGSLGNVATSADSAASSTKELNKATKSSTTETKKSATSSKNFGGAIMGTSFALTGLVGAASMFDNKLGEVAQKIMPFTGAISGATVALLMLKDTAIGAAVASRARAAQDVFNTTTAAASGGILAQFGKKLLGAVKAVGRFLGPWGLVISGIIAAAGGIFKLNEASEQYEQKLRGLSGVISLTSEQLEGLANKLGVQTTPSVFNQPFNIGDRPMDPEDFAAGNQLIEDYGGEGEFAKEFKPAIDAIMTAEGEELERAVEAMVVGLFGQGFGEEAIAEFLAALGIATEKMNIFENIDIGSLQFIDEGVVDVNVLEDVGRRSAQAYIDAYNAEVDAADQKQFTPEEQALRESRIEQLQQDIDLQQSALEDSRSQRGDAVRAGEDTTGLDASIEQQEKNLKESQILLSDFVRGFGLDIENLQIPLNELSAATTETLRGVSSAFMRGEIGVEDFEKGIDAALSGLKGIEDQTARIEAIKSVTTDLFPEQPEIAEAISDVEDLEILSRQLSLQMEIDPQYLDTISKANDELELNGKISTTTQNALNAARSTQNGLIDQEVEARERVNEQERISQAQQSIADMQEENAITQDKIDAYYDLTAAGASAAVAYKIVGDAALYADYTQLGAGDAAKTAGEDFETFLETVKNAIDLEKEFSGLNPTRSSGGGGGGTADTSAFDQITASLRKFVDAQVKVTSGFEDTISEIENFINVSGALTGEFGGLNEELRGLGLNENLIEMIVGMDPDEYEKRKNDLFIFDDRGTIIGMTSKLQGLNQALNTAVIGEFVNEQNNITVSVGHQITALQKLTAAGASYQAAYRAVQNTALAAAIATAKSSAQVQAAAEAAMRAQEMMDKFEEINEEEQRRERIRDAIVEQNREFSNQAKILNYITRNTNRLSEAQKEAILGDKDLQALVLEPSIAPGALKTALDNANKREELELKIKKLTITGQQEIWEDGLSKAMESFSAQEQELELKFKADTAEDQKIADAAAEEIEKLQFQLDDYEAGIEEIENQEDLINEVYDKRVESLEDIEDANERITRQQEAQLNIAEALSRGDIAAAAQAAQEARSLAAENAAEDREARLERAREANLGRVRSRGGMGRDELETAIRGIEQQIFRIEEDRLEPAEEAIRLADVRKEADIEALTVLGKTKTEWEEIKNRVDLAVVSNYKFVDAMQEALDIVEELVSKLNEPRPPPPPPPPPPAPKSSSKDHKWEGEMAGPKGREDRAQARREVANRKAVRAGKPPPHPDTRTAGVHYATGGYVARMAMGGFVRRAMPGPPSQSTGYAGGGFVRNRVSAPPQMFDNGGKVMGPGTSISDSIPALLSDGEYVINAKAVERIGVPNLDRLNKQSGGFFQKLKDGVMAFRNGGFLPRPPRFSAGYGQKKSSPPRPTIRSVDKSNPEKVAAARRGTSSPRPPRFSSDYGQKKSSSRSSSSRSSGPSSSDLARERARAAAERARAEAERKRRERRKALDSITSSISTPRLSNFMQSGLPSASSAPGPLEARARESQSSNFRLPTAVETEQGLQAAGQFIGNLPGIKQVGEAITSETVGGGIARGVIAALSTPADIIGGVVEGAIRGGNMVAQGNMRGLVEAIPVVGAARGIRNAWSGVIDPSKMQSGMFSQAGQYVADNRLFGATDAEGQARARLIGGALEIVGDPLTYLGIGAVSKAVKGAGAVAKAPGIDSQYLKPPKFSPSSSTAGPPRPTTSTTRPLAPITSETRTPIVPNREIRGPGQISSQIRARLQQEKIARETRKTFNQKRPEDLGSVGRKQYNELRDAMVRMDRTSIGPEFPVPESISNAIPHISQLSGKELFSAASKLKSYSNVLPDFDSLSASGIRTSPAMLRTSNRRTAVSELNQTALGKNSIWDKILDGLGILSPAKQKAVSSLNSVARAQNNFIRGANSLPSGVSLDTLSARFTGQLGAYPKINIADAAKAGQYSDDFGFAPRAYVPGSNGVGILYNLRGDSLVPTASLGRKVGPVKNSAPLGPLSTLIDESKLLPNRDDFTLMHEYSHIYDKMAKIPAMRLPTNSSGYVSKTNNASLNAIEEGSAKIFDAAVSGRGVTNPYPAPFANLEQIAKNPEFLFNLYGKNKERWYQFGKGWLEEHLSVIEEGAKQFNIPVYSAKTMRELEEVHAFFTKHDVLSSISGESAPSLDFFKDIALKAQEEIANTGINKLSSFANGGYVMGSDTIPARLTRGEYVIKRPAVENFGIDNLEKINNGTYTDGSVYNYSLSVNVKSDSNPDQIARTVMDQIKRVDSQRIRGNRF